MEIIEIDVRGLSCPEPVLMTMDAMEDYPGKTIRVIGDEAHTKANLMAMLKHQKKKGTLTEKGHEFEILIEA